MGVLCYCLVTIKKLAVFRCKYNSKNATICYVLFFKSKFYSSLFLIKDDIAKLKIFLRKLRSPNRFTSVLGFFFTTLPPSRCRMCGNGGERYSRIVIKVFLVLLYRVVHCVSFLAFLQMLYK